MPKQVDFYILETSDETSRMKTVCRLAEKIQRMEHNILVLTTDDEQSHMLDALMWTFSQSSFLPHAVAGALDQDRQQTPVLIHHQMLNNAPEVLINLKVDIPQSVGLKRVVEIINQDEQVKVSGRHKYRNYKNQNFAIKTHHISAK